MIEQDDQEASLEEKLLSDAILFGHLENDLLWEKPEDTPSIVILDESKIDLRVLAAANCIRDLDEKYDLTTGQFLAVLKSLRIDRRKNISDELFEQVAIVVDLAKFLEGKRQAESAQTQTERDTVSSSKDGTNISLAKNDPQTYLKRMKRLENIFASKPVSAWLFVIGCRATPQKKLVPAYMRDQISRLFPKTSNWSDEIIQREISIVRSTVER